MHFSPSRGLALVNELLDRLVFRPQLEIAVGRRHIGWEYPASPMLPDRYRLSLHAQIQVLNLSPRSNRIRQLTVRCDGGELPYDLTHPQTGQAAAWRPLGHLENQWVSLAAVAFPAERDVEAAFARIDRIEIDLEPIHGPPHRFTFARYAFPLTAVP